MASLTLSPLPLSLFLSLSLSLSLSLCNFKQDGHVQGVISRVLKQNKVSTFTDMHAHTHTHKLKKKQTEQKTGLSCQAR